MKNTFFTSLPFIIGVLIASSIISKDAPKTEFTLKNLTDPILSIFDKQEPIKQEPKKYKRTKNDLSEITNKEKEILKTIIKKENYKCEFKQLNRSFDDEFEHKNYIAFCTNTFIIKYDENFGIDILNEDLKKNPKKLSKIMTYTYTTTLNDEIAKVTKKQRDQIINKINTVTKTKAVTKLKAVSDEKAN